MSEELKKCEHKIPGGLPRCCHGIAIFDWGKTPLYPSCGCGAYFHVPRPAVNADKLVPLNRKKLYELRSKVEQDWGVEEYEFRGDDGDYTPSENEKFLMEDFHEGFMENFFDELLSNFGQPKYALRVPSVEQIETIINDTYCVSCDVFTAKGKLENSKTIAKAIHALLTERK